MYATFRDKTQLMVGIHNFFHFSQPRKCIGKDRLIPDVLEVELGPYLSFEYRPVAIVDQRVKELKDHIIPRALVS